MQLEKLSDAMYMPDYSERVRLIALCFRDLAETLWRDIKAMRSVEHMQWLTFTQLFHKQHFLESEREALRY